MKTLKAQPQRQQETDRPQRPLCDLCARRRVKMHRVRYHDSLVDICGRCHQTIRSGGRVRRRDFEGQTLFPFMNVDESRPKEGF